MSIKVTSWAKLCLREAKLKAAAAMDTETNAETSNSNHDNSSDISTADTVDDLEEIQPTCVESQSDEAFTYLQGLNSDNLMQFSQQSALQELLNKEHQQAYVKTEVKSHNLDVLPTLEEHDIGGYKFQLKIMRPKGKTNFYYSNKLNKVYVRMNQTFTVEAFYTPKTPPQQMRIRAFMCFAKEICEPVMRCQNHLSKDLDSEPAMRHSFLRSNNPSVQYWGKPDGKSITDRCAVTIPLPMSGIGKQEEGAIKQTIVLNCSCQNSCVGRRETTIIFLLESNNGEILSQRLLDVKICSCPKRDKDMDERNIESNKRKMDDDLYPGSAKIQKSNIIASLEGMVKKEQSSDLDEGTDGTSKRFDFQRTASGSYSLLVEFDNKQLMRNVIDSIMKEVAKKIVEDPQQAGRYIRDYKKLKRLFEKGPRL